MNRRECVGSRPIPVNASSAARSLRQGLRARLDRCVESLARRRLRGIAATGEHGDLLDVIRATCGLADFHDVADEARRFLNQPRPEPDLEPEPKHQPASAPAGSPESARRLFTMSQPITGTIVEAYLRTRGITALHGTGALRFHPRCYYRPIDTRRPRPGRR